MNKRKVNKEQILKSAKKLLDNKRAIQQFVRGNLTKQDLKDRGIELV